MKWLEVQLTVKGELAEPVAEVLSRYCPGGAVLTSETQFEQEDGGSRQVTVAGFLPMDQELEAAKRRIEVGLWHLSQISPLPKPSYRPIEAENWAEAWRDHYQPIAVGQKLLILPAWLESEDESRKIVRIDPGMAFGTGTHPTTILCLELIEQVLRPGEVMVDLGCGSGILGIAALKLGAAKVFAYDSDSQAIKSTRQNSTLNHLQDKLSPIHGSMVTALEKFKQDEKPDLVVANILASVLESMLMGGMANLLGPHSTLILSGILETQVDNLLEVGQRAGLTVQGKRQQEDWLALLLKKQPAPH